MSQWPMRPLGEVADFVGGGTPSRTRDDYWSGDIRWASIKDFSSQSLASTVESITPEGLANSTTRLIPTGHVIVASRVGLGKVAINEVPVAINQDLKAVILKPGTLLPRYLLYFLISRAGHLERLGVGATVKGLTTANFQSLMVPVPSLREQEQIVRMLDEADAIRKLRAQADQRTADLIPALFHDMFGDPKNNPMGWPDRSLRELSDRLSDGPFGSNLKSSHYMNSGVRVIRLQNIGVGQFIDSDAAFISQKHFDQLRKHSCFPGDVIVGTLGNPNLRACVLPPEIPIALNKADCVQIRPNREIANADFICSLLNLPSTLEMVSGMILGQTRSRISMGRLAALVVPVPPLPLQQEFATRVAEVRCMQEHQMTSGSAGQATFEAILDGVFSTKD